MSPGRSPRGCCTPRRNIPAPSAPPPGQSWPVALSAGGGERRPLGMTMAGQRSDSVIACRAQKGRITMRLAPDQSHRAQGPTCPPLGVRKTRIRGGTGCGHRNGRPPHRRGLCPGARHRLLDLQRWTGARLPDGDSAVDRRQELRQHRGPSGRFSSRPTRFRPAAPGCS